MHTDHLGTLILATDKQGTTTWAAVTESFGATGVLQSSAITMNLRFPGQYWDGEMGSHYNFQRQYIPHSGRYSKSDPIGLSGGINLFVYILGNPVNGMDPLGLIAPHCVDHIFGKLEVITDTVTENLPVGEVRRPGLIPKDPGPQHNLDPRFPGRFPVKPGPDWYFVWQLFAIWEQNEYATVDYFQRYVRICRWIEKDKCGIEISKESYTPIRKHLENESTKTLVSSRSYEIFIRNILEIKSPF